MALNKIPLIQRVLSFACNDPVDLFRYSTVCEDWAETASKYPKITEEFDIFSDRTITALERGSNGVFDAFLIASRAFDPLKLEKSKSKYEPSEKATFITKMGLVISKNFHRPEAAELMKWFGLSQYQICYLAAWNGNKVVFDLTKEGLDLYDSSHYFDIKQLEDLDFNLSDSEFCSTNIAQATIHGGNMELFLEYGINEYFDLEYSGDRLTVYDFAALSCNREIIWKLLERDIEYKWQYREDDVYEMFDDSLDVEEEIRRSEKLGPKFPDTYRFMRYLGQCNHLPYRGPDQNDDWERAKFEKLFEEYPNWYSVQVLLVFKKRHFYDIIEKNIERISPDTDIPALFLHNRALLFEKDKGDEIDFDWFMKLLIEKRPDLEASAIIKAYPYIHLLEYLKCCSENDK